MDNTSPLPKAPNKSEHYEAITEADGLMNNTLSLWKELNDIENKKRTTKDTGSFTRLEMMYHFNEKIFIQHDKYLFFSSDIYNLNVQFN